MKNVFVGPNGLFGSKQLADKDKASLPYFQQDRDRLGGMLDGRNPYAGQEWGGLVSQLQQQASGKGPSLAMDAYRQASQDTSNQLASMGRGSANPGASRRAMMEMGRVGQGMAAGLSTARTQEQMAAQQNLAQALSTRDQLNQNAYLDVLAKQLGLSKDQLQAQMSNNQVNAALGAQPTAMQKLAGTLGSIFGGVGKAGG